MTLRGDPVTQRSPLLLLLLLPSWAAALHPRELFPYGQSRGDQLLQEGDDESSAAVSLAIPLHFYEAQFKDLYVSLVPPGEGLGEFLAASSSHPRGWGGVSLGVHVIESLPLEGRK